MRLNYAGMSDVGRVRSENQDAIALPPPDAPGPWLFLLADGMGGVAGGARASGLAIKTVLEAMGPDKGEGPPADPAPLLRRAAERANREIRAEAGRDPSLTGMGTTLVAAFIQEGRIVIANVGDSRAYLMRGGELTQISEDHSLVQQEVARGLLTPEQARNHAMKNVLTRALGAADELEVDLFTRELARGDTLLLCSDGLHGPVPPTTIAELLMASRRPDEAAERLVDAANSQGGPDNVSVVVARVEELNASDGGPGNEPGTDTRRQQGRRRPGGLRGLLDRLRS